MYGCKQCDNVQVTLAEGEALGLHTNWISDRSTADKTYEIIKSRMGDAKAIRTLLYRINLAVCDTVQSRPHLDLDQDIKEDLC